ncbi:MAG TPA: histidine phosphatase family protein [Hyphomicrobiales bacterium]|nr:histidine phosphatase family protein [Hyphomicrobiales bacterium]
MLLLLARHGNTFEAGEKVTWAGARTDPPLTAKGKDQAQALGIALRPLNARLKRILHGPLRRTAEHADIAARVLGFTGILEIDERLKEIDYGLWEGKSSDEIKALGAEAELSAWNERGVWPCSPQWSPPSGVIARSAVQLAEKLAAVLARDDAALVVSSNGILRYFLNLVPRAYAEMAKSGKLRVATGNCCALHHSGAGWQLVFWDREPKQLKLE